MRDKECELPSYYAAQRFWVEGNPFPVIGTLILRSALIGVPLYLINGKPLDSTKNALIASTAVQLYVLYKTYHFTKNCTPQATRGVPIDYKDGLHISNWES